MREDEPRIELAVVCVGGSWGDWGEISGAVGGVVSASSIGGERVVVCNVGALYGHYSSLLIVYVLLMSLKRGV